MHKIHIKYTYIWPQAIFVVTGVTIIHLSYKILSDKLIFAFKYQINLQYIHKYIQMQDIHINLKYFGKRVLLQQINK